MEDQLSDDLSELLGALKNKNRMLLSNTERLEGQMGSLSPDEIRQLSSELNHQEEKTDPPMDDPPLSVPSDYRIREEHYKAELFAQKDRILAMETEIASLYAAIEILEMERENQKNKEKPSRDIVLLRDPVLKKCALNRWKQRYAALARRGDHHVLQLTDRADGAKPLAYSIFPNRANVAKVNHKEHSFVLVIHTDKRNKKAPVLELSLDDEETYEQWYHALAEAAEIPQKVEEFVFPDVACWDT